MKLRIVLSAAAVVLLTQPAMAATTSTTMAVTATVTTSCIVAATPVVFGNYAPTATSDTAATGTITVTCTTGTAYKVGLDAGAASGATVTTRKMSSGANLLAYGLYQDAGHSTNWGNTPGTDTVNKTATVTPDVITVYGLLPKQQNVSAGAYTDTVNVTVNY
ncbi:MAG: spore coat U domain-containing protein [Nevskiaceae bacterium]|nr:MAG: spore coat U domain-containing protein [Nevskiaceae bacterium]